MINRLSMILANPTMKMNSKKIFAIALAVSLNLAVAGSVLAFGAVDNLLNAKKKSEEFKEDATSKGICLKIDEILSSVSGRMNQKGEQIEERIQNRIREAEKNRKERSESLSEFRDNADEWREESYGKLGTKAKTNEQKAAVEKFKKDIEAAVEARRDAIDAAIDAFRNGVDDAWLDHKSSIEGAAGAYRETVMTAFKKAKSDCEDGVDAKTVRANLHNSLRAAREQLKEDRTGVTKLRDSMHALVESKKTAFEIAISDFKAAVQAAVTELKKSFPESSEGESAE